MVLIDLDNCVSDDGWRRRFINESSIDPLERYHGYHVLCRFDRAFHQSIWTGRNDVVVLTMRPILYRIQTVEWLKDHGCMRSKLVMREMHDHRRSAVIKAEQIQKLQHDGHHIDVAYDDRSDVIEAYRKLGFNARQLAINQTYAD